MYKKINPKISIFKLKETPQKNVINSPLSQKSTKSSTTNLSKSASQSSILSIFKNTFSPFAIRKWRSKSRDKLITKPELSTFDVVDNSSKPPLNPRVISPDTNRKTINTHQSMKNSYYMNSANVPDHTNEGIYQKNQLTPNQIKLRNKINKKTVLDETVNSNHGFINTTTISINNPIKIESETTVLTPESPKSFQTTATNKSKTDSSVCSSLSSSNSSFVLPYQQPKSSQPAANSLNQINMFLNNLSPNLSRHEPRQKSERINLTCLLNGYGSKKDEDDQIQQFSSKSTNNITYVNDINSTVLSNRDSMNKSADILNNSGRFYDLKKKV